MAPKTRTTLLDWDQGQAASERLSAHVLHLAGFHGIDPIHPLGGRDGLKDIVATKDGLAWVAGCYFPNGKKDLKEVNAKFRADADGVKINNASAFAFCTNQHLTDGERKSLIATCEFPVEIYHLERIAGLLDRPNGVGIRLQYLDIQMSKEDQLSFLAEAQLTHTAKVVEELRASNKHLQDMITGGTSFPLARYINRSGENTIDVVISCEGEHPLYDVEIHHSCLVSSGPTRCSALYPGRLLTIATIQVDQLKHYQDPQLHVVARNGQFVQVSVIAEIFNTKTPSTPRWHAVEYEIRKSPLGYKSGYETIRKYNGRNDPTWSSQCEVNQTLEEWVNREKNA